MQGFLKIDKKDNTAVALETLKKGTAVSGVELKENIPAGHKFALEKIEKSESVIKYGCQIGLASEDIEPGEFIHSHNLKSALSEREDYEYVPKKTSLSKTESGWITGYENENGSFGIRNEIWILPLVGCVNKTAERLCAIANERLSGLCGGFKAFTHPYGCSQLGEDHENTQKTLAALANHPNAAGVLLLSLGCENNNLKQFLPILGDYNEEKTKTLVTQDCENELEEGMKQLTLLAKRASGRKRSKISAERLVIGYKCGGSDAFSGISANPLCGRLTNLFTSMGGSAILTEVPEMFGAERLLMNRAENAEVFKKITRMINDFKDYYISSGQPVYENPSPGNREGGITTLEEKSLGCIQKGGEAAVTDVLTLAQKCKKPGLSLLTGPGNDIVSCTNLAASGAHIIIFTTGRGTPLGAPVPTIKVSSNSLLAKRKPGWIDYDAGEILNGKSFDAAARELLSIVLSVANGETKTKNEINGYSEIAIFKNGVTL